VRVALFLTCMNDTLFPDVGIATVQVLERLGHEVEFPEAQTCCGQLHLNSGYQDAATDLARRFVHVFADTEVVVAPSASCVASVREFYPYLAEQFDDPGLAAQVDAIVPRVMELTEFLVRHLGVTDVGAHFPQRVTYHPTCHSLRGLHLGDAPRALLQAVDGLEFIELPGASECCGFGGTFAVKNAETSSAILESKLENIAATNADVVTAVDRSCLMQIGGGLSRMGSEVRTLHIAEILAATP
jgi:L-lactate dehydrogenase complex protein LldE